MNREGAGRPGQPAFGAAETLDRGETAASSPPASAPASADGSAPAAGPGDTGPGAAAAVSAEGSARERGSAPEHAGPQAPDAEPEQDAELQQDADPEQDATAQGPAAGGQRAAGRRLRAAAARPGGRHVLLLIAYLAAGIAATWPETPHLLGGGLPSKTDVTSYVWGLWWVAHQVSSLGNPFSTTYMAAPVGIQLGYDTLMPLPGLLLTPVTWVFGPSVSFAVLTIAAPGLLCYVMYRAARLWLGQAGSVAAGAMFGLATMLTWQNAYHLNISLGSLFLPMTLEAAIRLRRRPAVRTGIGLGVVLGAAVLVNQESAVLAVLLAAALLVPWLAVKLVTGRRTVRASLLPLAAGALLALVIAAPQLIAMAQYSAAGGADAHAPTLSTTSPTGKGEAVGIQLAQTYGEYGVGVPTMFSPSPRLATYHVGQLWGRSATAYYGFGHQATYAFNRDEGAPTFGALLTLAGLAGLVVGWRRRGTWWFALLWLTGAVLALGPTLIVGTRTYLPLEVTWNGQHLSNLLPYTWLIRTPGLSALREADRLAVLGLVGAALLAGGTADWLWRHRRRAWPVIAVAAVLAAAELGWTPGSGSGQVMPMTMPSLDQAIARDHSHSIVLDIPYGLRGGIPLYGARISIRPLLLGTADGHPRAISYSSWVPGKTWDGIYAHMFFRQLVYAQNGAPIDAQQLAAARRDLTHLNIGWVLIWRAMRPSVINYLEATGFRYYYQADGVTVLRPAASFKH